MRRPLPGEELRRFRFSRLGPEGRGHQGRSPALDLDSVYGRGPTDQHDRIFYQRDGVSLKVGRTSATDFPDN